VSDGKAQFSEYDIAMARLGLQLRLSVRLLARGIACFVIVPILFFIVHGVAFLVLGGAFAAAGVFHILLGLKNRRAADRGLVELADRTKAN
jgi:hypothetical protein